LYTLPISKCKTGKHVGRFIHALYTQNREITKAKQKAAENQLHVEKNKKLERGRLQEF